MPRGYKSRKSHPRYANIRKAQAARWKRAELTSPPPSCPFDKEPANPPDSPHSNRDDIPHRRYFTRSNAVNQSESSQTSSLERKLDDTTLVTPAPESQISRPSRNPRRDAYQAEKDARNLRQRLDYAYSQSEEALVALELERNIVNPQTLVKHSKTWLELQLRWHRRQAQLKGQDFPFRGSPLLRTKSLQASYLSKCIIAMNAQGEAAVATATCSADATVAEGVSGSNVGGDSGEHRIDEELCSPNTFTEPTRANPAPA